MEKVLMFIDRKRHSSYVPKFNLMLGHRHRFAGTFVRSSPKIYMS